MTPLQCHLARTILNLTQAQFATLVGCSRSTIYAFESSAYVHLRTIRSIQLYLIQIGIRFPDPTCVTFDAGFNEKEPTHGQ